LKSATGKGLIETKFHKLVNSSSPINDFIGYNLCAMDFKFLNAQKLFSCITNDLVKANYTKTKLQRTLLILFNCVKYNGD